MKEQEKQDFFERIAKEGYSSVRRDFRDSVFSERKRVSGISARREILGKALTDIYSKESRLHTLIENNPDIKTKLDETLTMPKPSVNDFQVIGVYPILPNLQKELSSVDNYGLKIQAMITFAANKYLGTSVQTPTKLKPAQSKLITTQRDEINEILGKFQDYMGIQFTYRNVFENKNKLDVKTAELIDGTTLTQNQIRNYLKIIDESTSFEKRTLKPISGILRNYKTESTSSRFNVNINRVNIIGDLDFKTLKNRRKVYAFWEEKHGEYEGFKNAFSEFVRAADNLTFKGDLKKIIDEIKSFKDEVESDDFNYIVPFKPMQLPSHKKMDKHVVLFEQILSTNGLLPKVKEEFKNESDGESITVNVYDKEGGYQGVTEELASTSQTKGQLDSNELVVLGKKLGELENIEVDPIYYIEYTNKAFSKPTPVFEAEIERLKDLLLLETEKYKAATGTNVEDDVLKYINTLSKLASIKEDKYYLPLTTTVMSKIIPLENNKRSNDKKIKSLIKFLKAFSKLYEPDDLGSIAPSKTGIEPRRSKRGTDSKGLLRPLIANLGSVASESPTKTNRQLKKINKELKDLLKEISNFFIKPMYGSNLPYKESFGLDVDDLEKRIFRIIQSYDEDDDTVFTYMMSESKEMGYTKYRPRHIKELTDYLTEVYTPKKIGSMRELLQLIEKGMKIVIRIADLDRNDKITKRGINVEFGHMLYEILEENNLLNRYYEYFSKSTNNKEGRFPNSKGKKLKELYDEHDSNQIYPLQEIIREIYSHRGDLGQTIAGKGKPIDKSIINEFVDIVDDIQNRQEDIKLKMLKAHDNIRKMEGKPVYYNTSSLTNFNHVNAAIDIMKNDYQVDVTAHEIISIVNEIDSFKEISMKHGVPKESVYFLKANFR